MKKSRMLHRQIRAKDPINESWSVVILTRPTSQKRVNTYIFVISLCFVLFIELEEKQRVIRRRREEEVEQAAQKGLSVPEYQPKWFEKAHDETTGASVYIFKGDYWECKEKQVSFFRVLTSLINLNLGLEPLPIDLLTHILNSCLMAYLKSDTNKAF
jgi:hypothetical protein